MFTKNDNLQDNFRGVMDTLDDMNIVVISTEYYTINESAYYRVELIDNILIYVLKDRFMIGAWDIGEEKVIFSDDHLHIIALIHYLVIEFKSQARLTAIENKMRLHG